MNTTVLILLGIVTSIITFAVGYYISYRRSVKKISYIMDALEDGETNFRFVENSKINIALNRMRIIFEKFRQESEVESWSKLIRVLTHEIMNTITPISSLSESLAKDDTLDYKAGLQTISQSSKELINFVNSYRSLSRISAPVKKPVIVSDMVRKVLQLNLPLAKQYDVEFSYKELSKDIILYADEGQISQILINLIKNACQANSKNIIITAELTAAEDVVIKVVDDGMAISHECKEQIFIPFYTTKEGGSGIGLSLSRQIMRLHNGTLELESSDNKATVFALIFK